MFNELISVIIPIYNVEQYLSRCIESIQNQTYKNLQLIFVDDGTKDNSAEIVKNYAKNDKRIELYQKINGGLSSARNYGMKYIRGKYVCFIDSDDWVEENYIEILYKQMKQNNAEIACAGFDYAYSDRCENYSYDMKDVILNKHDAILALCEGKWMTNHVWNKMYAVRIFTDIHFEEGRCFEDTYIMHQIFAKAKIISCSSNIIYHYFMRDTSIIHEQKPQNDADIFIGYFNRYHFLRDAEARRLTLKYCAWSCYKVIYLVDSSKIKEEDFCIACRFWEEHREIAKLGIKYWLMYKMPEFYKKIIVKK